MTEATVCLTNLTATGKRRRLVTGAVALVAGIVAHFVLRPEPGSWHLIFEPVVFVYGWLGVMQAAAGT